ncbi:hypothetical protein NDU88_007244 [Pleurodeles waltl]|uniref:Uncharacterized protein n=1 Tax=Pleurodeles waltl TaxID=8319 RepID=A0AAV7N1Q0_PLEWA|nr:hypothetical protein NDU88_007244 [Pleurodeles waltl]
MPGPSTARWTLAGNLSEANTSKSRMTLLAPTMGRFRETTSQAAIKEDRVVTADHYGGVKTALLGTGCETTIRDVPSSTLQHEGGGPSWTREENKWGVFMADYGEDSLGEGKVRDSGETGVGVEGAANVLPTILQTKNV